MRDILGKHCRQRAAGSGNPSLFCQTVRLFKPRGPGFVSSGFRIRLRLHRPRSMFPDHY